MILQINLIRKGYSQDNTRENVWAILDKIRNNNNDRYKYTKKEFAKI